MSSIHSGRDTELLMPDAKLSISRPGTVPTGALILMPRPTNAAANISCPADLATNHFLHQQPPKQPATANGRRPGDLSVGLPMTSRLYGSGMDVPGSHSLVDRPQTVATPAVRIPTHIVPQSSPSRSRPMTTSATVRLGSLDLKDKQSPLPLHATRAPVDDPHTAYALHDHVSLNVLESLSLANRFLPVCWSIP